MVDVTFKLSGDNLVLETVDGGRFVQTGPSTWSFEGAAPLALPAGAIGLWAFDGYTTSGGAHVPNLVTGGPDLAIASGALASGIFTGRGSITYPVAQTMNEFTAQVLVEVTAINGNNIIFYNTANSADFAFHSVSTPSGGPGVAVQPRTYNNFTVGDYPSNTQTQYGGFTNLVGKGQRVLTIRQTAAGESSLWIDDVKVYAIDGIPANPLTFTALTFGVGPDTVQSAHQYGSILALWPRGVSDAEVRSGVDALRARASANGVPIPALLSRTLIINGTSLDGGFDSNQWFWQFATHDTPENIGASYAVSGSTVAGMVSRAPLIKSILPPVAARTGRKFIYGLGGPTNDIPGLTTTTVLTTLIPAVQAHMLDMQAAGFLLAMATIGSRGDLVGAAATNFDAVRAVYNSYLLAHPTSFGLASTAQIADIGSVTGIGSTFDATKFNGDKLHHNAAGGALAEVPWRAVLNAL